MAEPLPEVVKVKKLLWGETIKADLFQRWSQGFVYSPEEPTALVQRGGGPCAVLGPVQAFLLKQILLDNAISQNNAWRTLTVPQVDALLCQALTEILNQVSSEDEETSTDPAGSTAPPSQPANTPKYCVVTLQRENQQTQPMEVANNDSPNTADSQNPLTEGEFHQSLCVEQFTCLEDVKKKIVENISSFKSEYGVLQYLYSVLLTKGVDNLVEEMSENNELIDPIHGHGSQCLINLLLTGRGVNYVWDNDQDLGGLTLKGIRRRCEVGFLTILEKLRYCEVGTYLKNPKFPVWVVGSETHLTVTFSLDMRLVIPESPNQKARRIFRTYDPEGNNFIQAVLLEDVMRALDLYADPAYVEIMQKKLDPESFGIVLLEAFMDEFFPHDTVRGPDTFTLYHYNGLSRPSTTTQIKYREGNAILLESNLGAISDSDENKILTCLQTKWPSIDVQWIDGPSPSID